jgi:NADH dehydrogenase (ubiquinone) Fe-S protein 4
MQSGTFGLRKWKLDFSNINRWENQLIGWSSSGDPLSSQSLEFSSKEEAIIYCQRNGKSFCLIF